MRARICPFDRSPSGLLAKDIRLPKEESNGEKRRSIDVCTAKRTLALCITINLSWSWLTHQTEAHRERRRLSSPVRSGSRFLFHRSSIKKPTNARKHVIGPINNSARAISTSNDGCSAAYYDVPNAVRNARALSTNKARHRFITIVATDTIVYWEPHVVAPVTFVLNRWTN